MGVLFLMGIWSANNLASSFKFSFSGWFYSFLVLRNSPLLPDKVSLCPSSNNGRPWISACDLHLIVLPFTLQRAIYISGLIFRKALSLQILILFIRWFSGCVSCLRLTSSRLPDAAIYQPYCGVILLVPKIIWIIIDDRSMLISASFLKLV